MNYRDYKHYAPNTYWHVYNRGNGKNDIFIDKEDYELFESRLRENLNPQMTAIWNGGHLGPGGAEIIGEAHTPYIRQGLPAGSFTLFSYCLMPNHYHLELRQNTTLPVSKLLTKICTSYSKYFNKKYNRVGHVFQDRFKAAPITNDSQLLWLSAYIHNNPLTARLVENLADYPWSSYGDYVNLRQGNLCDKDFIISMVGSSEIYQKFVAETYLKIRERKDLKSLLLDI